MRASEPTRGQAGQIASRNTQFPSSLAPSNESAFPANPFGDSRNRFSQGINAIGPNPSRSQAGSNSIRNITHSLMIVGFPDASEASIIPGDIGMVARTNGKHDSRHAVAEISYVNYQSRQEYRQGKEALLRGEPSTSSNTMRAPPHFQSRNHMPGDMPGRSPIFDMQQLKSNRKTASIYGQEEFIPGSRVLQNWSEYEARGLDNLPTESEVLEDFIRQSNISFADEQSTLTKLKQREAAQQRVFDVFREYLPVYGNYLTLDGMMRIWNFYAPVVRPSWSKPGGADPRSRNGTPSIVFGLTRRVFVINRWGADVEQGAILGFILKRQRNMKSDADSDGYREFAWLPYCSNARRLPSSEDLQFRAIDGSLEYGHFVFLGTANNISTGRTAQMTCRESMALDDATYLQARNKIGILDKIEVLVRHRTM